MLWFAWVFAVSCRICRNNPPQFLPSGMICWHDSNSTCCSGDFQTPAGTHSVLVQRCAECLKKWALRPLRPLRPLRRVQCANHGTCLTESAEWFTLQHFFSLSLYIHLRILRVVKLEVNPTSIDGIAKEGEHVGNVWTANSQMSWAMLAWMRADSRKAMASDDPNVRRRINGKRLGSEWLQSRSRSELEQSYSNFLLYESIL